MNALTAILPSAKMGSWPGISYFTGFKQAQETFSEVFNMVEPYIEEHERTLDPENIRDFLDLMIVEHQKSTDPKSCFNGKVGKATITNSVIDLFITGMETTTTSLMIVILQLLHHPDVQKKVHEEIDSVTNLLLLKRSYPQLQ
jgi:cytochrome P450